jgi:hypothetical protein
VSEQDIKRTVIAWLDLHRVMWWPNNTGAWKVGLRYIKFGKPGAPDIFALRNGNCFGIELKGPKGKQSQLQHDFQLDFTEAGGQYILARSLEDVMEVIR